MILESGSLVICHGIQIPVVNNALFYVRVKARYIFHCTFFKFMCKDTIFHAHTQTFCAEILYIPKLFSIFPFLAHCMSVCIVRNRHKSIQLFRKDCLSGRLLLRPPRQAGWCRLRRRWPIATSRSRSLWLLWWLCMGSKAVRTAGSSKRREV